MNFVYALIAGLFPSIVWLFFWLREDSTSPEPRWLLTASFLGGMAAVIAAIFVEKYISDTIFDSSLRYTLWAATEEILKLAAVSLIALNTSFNDEPIDAMVYCIVAALGFAALENTLFVMQPLAHGAIAESVVTGNMRFIGATLVHVVSSAMIGFGLGWTFYRGHAAKFLGVAIGLCAAITIHAAFNLYIINSDPSDVLKAFGWVWGAVILLIVLFEEVKAVYPRRADYAQPTGRTRSGPVV